MNLESLPRPETIHVTAPGALSRPTTGLSSHTMPQRSPFAIQELLGLGGGGGHGSSNNGSNENSHRSNGVVSAVTPSLYSAVGQSHFSDHHQMSMAASRMAYFNAHAAVAAAFLPHNIGGGGGAPLGFNPQSSAGDFRKLIFF